ncbi:MAG: hypothetical protein ACREF8_05960, partial [Chthoniobacterales bacterium]
DNRRGDVRIDRDLIGVVGEPGDPRGVVVGRPSLFVHEFNFRKPMTFGIREAFSLISFARSKGF